MKMICLDLDGTLEDSRSDMTAAVHRVRAGLGLPSRSDEAILPWVKKGMDPLYRACFDDYLQADEARLADVRSRYGGYAKSVFCADWYHDARFDYGIGRRRIDVDWHRQGQAGASD